MGLTRCQEPLCLKLLVTKMENIKVFFFLPSGSKFKCYVWGDFKESISKHSEADKTTTFVGFPTVAGMISDKTQQRRNRGSSGSARVRGWSEVGRI